MVFSYLQNCVTIAKFIFRTFSSQHKETLYHQQSVPIPVNLSHPSSRQPQIYFLSPQILPVTGFSQKWNNIICDFLSLISFTGIIFSRFTQCSIHHTLHYFLKQTIFHFMDIHILFIHQVIDIWVVSQCFTITYNAAVTTTHAVFL